MGNTFSSNTTPPGCPASPAILFSLSIVPPTIIFSRNHRPTRSQLVITLTNTTTRPITFRHVSTPLDVSRCFTYGQNLEPWTILDLTEDRVIPVVTETPPCRYDMVPTDPSSLKYDEEVFTTVSPGPKNSVTLSFHMNILEGLTAGHNYAIKLSDFETEAYWWGYGDKDDVVGKRNKNGGWAIQSNARGDTGKKARGPLLFRSLNHEGAVLKTKWNGGVVAAANSSWW